MLEKICVVVPVYNVEQYVEKCLMSLKNQTYKNLEVIVVNDGSTDSSAKICKQICDEDTRFKLLNKINGGLSDARNFGMKYCTSKYITFVDSDDFVSENYIMNLYNLIIDNKCDIACTNFVNTYENYTDKMNSKNFILNFTSKDAIVDVLYQRNIMNSAWGKLYLFSLFDDIEFPKGKLCEDLGTFYKLFEKCSKITYSSVQDYYYLQRSSSIMGSSFNEKKLDGLHFCEIIEQHFFNDSILHKASIYRICAECMFLLKRIPKCEKKYIISLKKYFKDYFFDIIFDSNIKMSFKLRFLYYYFFF